MHKLLDRISASCLAVNHVSMLSQNNGIVLRHLVHAILENTILSITDPWFHRMADGSNDIQILVPSQATGYPYPIRRILNKLFLTKTTTGRSKCVERQVLAIHEGLANFMKNFGDAKFVHILQQLQLIHARLQSQFRLKTRNEWKEKYPCPSSGGLTSKTSSSFTSVRT